MEKKMKTCSVNEIKGEECHPNADSKRNDCKTDSDNPVTLKDMAYIPKSVMLTGGAGFIGSVVLCRLVRLYPEIRFLCLDKLTYCGSVKNFESIRDAPNFVFVKGDILSTDLVNHLLNRYEIDTIMHFAAETHVDNSFGNSLVFTRVNVEGTHVLLECARAAGKQIRRFIMISTG